MLVMDFYILLRDIDGIIIVMVRLWCNISWVHLFPIICVKFDLEVARSYILWISFRIITLSYRYVFLKNDYY